MTKADELNALADRCEREEPSWDLSIDIELALHSGSTYSALEGVAVYVNGRHYNPPAYTTSIDAAATLEPKDAQEIVVRVYPNGRAYVRVTTKRGKVVYCDALDKMVTEPMARCAAALRAMAAELP